MTYDKDKYNSLLKIVYAVYTMIAAIVYMVIVLVDGGRYPRLLIISAVGGVIAVIVASMITKHTILKKAKEKG